MDMPMVDFTVEDGCEIHDHCQTCPLPRCRYDYEQLHIPTLIRKLKAFPLLERDATIKEIAEKVGFSTSSATKMRKAYEQVGGDLDQFINSCNIR
jgi:hypothetical protein